MASIRITKRSPTTPNSPLHSLRLLTVPEAAHYAKVSTQTIRRSLKAGRLKFYRAGRQIRIDESDLVNYLSS
jgi:excisionase family DNA binding protein